MRVTIFLADKTDFKTRTIKKDKEGHYIIRKQSVQEEDITLVNMHVCNMRACVLICV